MLVNQLFFKLAAVNNSLLEWFAFRLLGDTSSSAIALETALQGVLVIAKSGRLEQGYNI